MTTPTGKMPLGYQPIAARLPPQGMEQRYRQSFTRMMELIGMMYRAGIPMEDGTDTMAGL